MTEPLRILITGSRTWTDTQAIDYAISHALADHDRPAVVVTGGARGADELAATLAPTYGPDVTCERWPADWNRHGKAAGAIRDQEMVDAGAHVCLAFPLGEARGTRDCMRRAEAAGIRVIDYGTPACSLGS